MSKNVMEELVVKRKGKGRSGPKGTRNNFVVKYMGAKTSGNFPEAAFYFLKNKYKLSSYVELPCDPPWRWLSVDPAVEIDVPALVDALRRDGGA